MQQYPQITLLALTVTKYVPFGEKKKQRQNKIVKEMTVDHLQSLVQPRLCFTTAIIQRDVTVTKQAT